MDGDGAVPGLDGGHRARDICEDRHNDVLQLLSLHVVGEVFLIEQVL